MGPEGRERGRRGRAGTRTSYDSVRALAKITRSRKSIKTAYQALPYAAPKDSQD